MNQQTLIANMNAYKAENRRARLSEIVESQIGKASLDEIRNAAIEWHKATYHCGKVPTDTLNQIETALGLAEPIKKESAPFDPNW